MPEYHVIFERIGRRRDLPPQHFTAADDEELTLEVYSFARRILQSPGFQVTVDMETMTGNLEGGRFGTFTIAEQARRSGPAEEEKSP